MFETCLCAKGLSTGSQVEVTPWLAGPGFPSIRTSLAAPLKHSPLMEGRDCFTGHYMASRETGYKDKVHTGEEKKRGYRASGAENDLTDC